MNSPEDPQHQKSANFQAKTLFSHWIFNRKRQLLFWLLLLLLVGLGIHFVDSWWENSVRGSRPKIYSGIWGDLQESDIRLEQPLEYVGFEKTTDKGPFWSFGTLTEPSVRELLISSGCTVDQAEKLLRTRMSGTGAVFMLQPDEATLLSLSPETRSKLYLALAQNPANRFQASPYYVRNGDVEALFAGHQNISRKAISTMKKLLYTRNGFTYFSDPELVLKELGSDQERLGYLQVLTGQNAVLARLLVHPDTDIDKPMIYWALSMPGVLHKDLAPLLQAEKREPHGGSISMLYLLPPLARQKLYTTPSPPVEGEKMPDCHWTALNFFNRTIDPRMSDNAFASRFINENFYEVAKPGIAGDLVLLVNPAGQVVHSAVYLAHDIVFTKNGINFAQPWIMMHIGDMQGNFSALEPVKVAYFRRNEM